LASQQAEEGPNTDNKHPAMVDAIQNNLFMPEGQHDDYYATAAEECQYNRESLSQNNEGSGRMTMTTSTS
jgi:hypothetical protein